MRAESVEITPASVFYTSGGHSGPSGWRVSENEDTPVASITSPPTHCRTVTRIIIEMPQMCSESMTVESAFTKLMVCVSVGILNYIYAFINLF